MPERPDSRSPDDFDAESIEPIEEADDGPEATPPARRSSAIEDDGDVDSEQALEVKDVAAAAAGAAAGAAERPHWVFPLAGGILVALILYLGRPVLLPLALATLLAFLVTPLCEWLEHRRVPRVAATVAMVVLIAAALLGVGGAVYGGLAHLGNHWDEYSRNVIAKAQRLGGFGGGDGGDDSGVEKLVKGVGNLSSELAEGAQTAEAVGDAVEGDAPATQPAVAVVEGEPPTAGAAETTETAELIDRFGLSLETLADRNADNREALRDVAAQIERATAEFRAGLREEPVRVIEEAPEATAIDRARQILAALAGPVGTAGLVAVFLLFILLQRDDLRDRVIKLAAGRRINLATQALDDAARRISRYLRAQAIVNGTYGLAIGLGLITIGYTLGDDGDGVLFPGWWLWAVLCGLLRFIPYLGPWLAASFPVFVSIGHYEGAAVAVAVIAMFVVVELVSNNVMEPVLYGSAVGMSDFAVIIAATVWTFLWGPVGLLVATPLTTCLVVLGKYVPALRPFDTLLGSEPVLSPHSRLYQRLLSLDADDAEDEVRAYREGHTLTETFDDLMLPTLALSERDRESGNLTEERIAFIRETMTRFVVELGEQEEPLPSDSVDIHGNPTDTSEADERTAGGRAHGAGVVLLPASDEADETAAMMLKVLLDRRGFVTTTVDADALASEKLAAVGGDETGNGGADVVVVSAVPPKAAVRARYLVKRLEACGGTAAGARGDAQVVVGIWDRRVDPALMRRRVCGAGDPSADKFGNRVRVMTTLADAVEAVRQRAEVARARSAPTEVG